ncbi:hypothetical protein [Mycolicibacterium porcinum]|uniref:Uncharacterized protein n=1 Tax=Mycolicibacterium porcinum TaxID=39693 RepID=A0AAW5SWB1_9MYCO|nr:hypothetical protein [Mycolicibacterium porcinum]MCV7386643.1 hypothetical protein [Mycolicibacterium porcinum]CDO30684.1 hypothetical protein BN979_03493 [Mycolicibacterium vulneris]
MSGSEKSDDNLHAGRTNHAQDPTRLFANEDGHIWGNELQDPQGPVLDVDAGDTGAACAIQAAADQHGIAGISTSGFNGIKATSSAFNGGRAVWALGGAFNTGVYGSGDPGLRGEGESANGNGVEGQSAEGDGVLGYSADGVGVRGTSQHGGTGLKGDSDSGDGVAGTSRQGRGGTFSSDRIAQLRLEPHFGAGSDPLPCTGKVGDLLMYSLQSATTPYDPSPQGNAASLYLCVRSSPDDNHAAEEQPAIWVRFQFDGYFTCRDGAPPPLPNHPHGFRD